MTVVSPWPKNGLNASHATTLSPTSSSLCSSSRLPSSTAPSSTMEHHAPFQAIKPLPALELTDPSLHSPISSSPATPLPIAARSASVSRRKNNTSVENHQQRPLSASSTPDDSTQRKPRKMLGNYTLSKTLGAGSMGKVKLAVHGVTGHKVSYPHFYYRVHPISLQIFVKHSLRSIITSAHVL